MFRKRLAVMTVAVLTVLALAAGCSKGSQGGSVTIGSKDFTENILLGEMVAQVIEGNSDVKVTRKLNLGGTSVNFDGLKRGDLDMYVDYDGTGYSVHLGHEEPIADPTKIYDQVKKEFEEKFKVTWSKPFGFNNTYAIAMPRKLAEANNIKTISDLAKQPDKFVFGTTNEFMGRKADGYDPLVQTYGLKFKDVKRMTAGLRYNAIQQDEIHVMDAYATDGKLKEFDMMILKDDKNFFPPYNGAVLVRMETLEKNAGLMDVLNKLAGQLNDETMQELNYRVDVKGESVETVAGDFLKSKSLVK
ncbi:MAG TPA: glycine betaine ABC transporter substrate-binding protein [Symbiobacteriaceae bacterium]|nr:glycine betaine ABC transporter substrate-binding protein [Symbiobacteriaceae bacterium]